MDALILAGGFGTRLSSVVRDRPKPMAEVMGRPFLEWLVLQLKSQGVRRVIVCTGYLGEQIESHFGDGARFGVEMVYSREAQPLGTGGAIRLALPQMRGDDVLALNGDSYCDFDLDELRRAHESKQAAATLWLARVDDVGRFGSVELNSDGAVTTFTEKASQPRAGHVSAGVYALSRRLIEAMPADVSVSIEREVFPRYVGRGLFGVVGSGAFLDIGTPEAYIVANETLRLELDMLETQTLRRERASRAAAHLAETEAAIRAAREACIGAVLDAVDILADTFRRGHKLMICGNGGSAADAQHLAAEFVGRLTKDFARPPLPAIALTTDTSFITAHANDVGFDDIFARQVRALGAAGDALVAFSTSGNSRNVIAAADAARDMGIRSIGFVGEGGALTDKLDCTIVIPSRNTQTVQEVGLPLYHILCDLTERALFGGQTRS